MAKDQYGDVILMLAFPHVCETRRRLLTKEAQRLKPTPGRSLITLYITKEWRLSYT